MACPLLSLTGGRVAASLSLPFLPHRAAPGSLLSLPWSTSTSNSSPLHPLLVLRPRPSAGVASGRAGARAARSGVVTRSQP
ncbi:hypothetical protein PAHAL_4G184400 [Panicum hallii]|uniref:Uncharacterized protein n=1 Tax=Panicum hallii TaxID=206008 RepID=A0A2T8JDB1_9POAL|nr:hypothetical protein PAHAL_4G184400 [Panicum hallii]